MPFFTTRGPPQGGPSSSLYCHRVPSMPVVPGAFPPEVPAGQPQGRRPVQSIHKQEHKIRELPGKWPTREIRDAEWYQGNSDGQRVGQNAGLYNHPQESLETDLLHKELGFARTNIGRVSEAYLVGFKQGWVEGYNEGKMSWQAPAKGQRQRTKKLAGRALDTDRQLRERLGVIGPRYGCSF